MMTLPNTISEYSELAAREFLQTAVFVDDRIYDRHYGTVTVPKNITPPRHRKKAVKSAEAKSSDETSIKKVSAEQVEEYSPHDIVNSFAKKQIVCSLYQPKKDAKVSRTSEIFPLCKAADIVIVDWDLYGDKGKKAIELVDGLIQQAAEDVPEQLRLILVYTQETNLFDIADQLFQKVSASIGDEITPLQEEGGLSFHTSNSRVSVLGKTGRTRPAEYQSHEVNEKDLADRAVAEFAKLASGLLHATVLLGLSEIKKNSRKILSKFSSSLDAAYLTHRALSLPDEEAASHLIPLMISEIASVLEDSLPHPLITEGLIKDWCENVWKPGAHVNGMVGTGVNKKTLASDFCLKGKAMRDSHKSVALITQTITKKNEWNNSDRAKFRDITSLLLDNNKSTSNHEFSRLMSSRTYYGERSKDLKLGTIVSTEIENKTAYLLCLQPVCDSVRLTKKRKFVFVELDEMERDGAKNKASHSLLMPDGNIVELVYRSKSFNCYVAEFQPEGRSTQILAKFEEDKGEIYIDSAGKTYFWHDQLKTAHAQRAVERYARELSRVGLTESEWQRLLN